MLSLLSFIYCAAECVDIIIGPLKLSPLTGTLTASLFCEVEFRVMCKRSSLTRERAKYTSIRIVSGHQWDQFQSCPLDNTHILESGNEVFVVLVGVLRVFGDEVHQEWHHWITFEIVWKVSHHNPEWLNHCTVRLHDWKYCLAFLSDFFSWLVGHSSLVQNVLRAFRGLLICPVALIRYEGRALHSAHSSETWLCLKISKQQL